MGALKQTVAEAKKAASLGVATEIEKNFTLYEGCSALMWASMCGKALEIRELLLVRADINLQNGSHRTAADLVEIQFGAAPEPLQTLLLGSSHNSFSFVKTIEQS